MRDSGRKSTDANWKASGTESSSKHGAPTQWSNREWRSRRNKFRRHRAVGEYDVEWECTDDMSSDMPDAAGPGRFIPISSIQNGDLSSFDGSKSTINSISHSCTLGKSECSNAGDPYFGVKFDVTRVDAIPQTSKLGKIAYQTSELDRTLLEPLKSTENQLLAPTCTINLSGLFSTPDTEISSNYEDFYETAFGAGLPNALTPGNSESSEESDSTLVSDYSEHHLVLEDGHPFVALKPLVVRHILLAFQTWRQRPQESSDRPATTIVPGESSGANSNQGSCGKRGRGDGSRRQQQDDNNEQGGSRKRQRVSTMSSTNRVSFACPFAKKNPLRYRSCYSFVLSRIQDIKQHLSRCHQLPIYCPRCMTTFETEAERDEHARNEPPCALRDDIVYEGVTKIQKTLLSQRVSAQMARDDQWFTIFDILFPEHNPRPRSAYVNNELTEELEVYQDFTHAEGPNIIARAIRSSGLDVTSLASEERDLLTLLHVAIAEGLQVIAQRWSVSAISEFGATSSAPSEEPVHSLPSSNFSSRSRASLEGLSSSTPSSIPTHSSLISLPPDNGYHPSGQTHIVQSQGENVFPPVHSMLEQEYQRTLSALELEADGNLWSSLPGVNYLDDRFRDYLDF